MLGPSRTQTRARRPRRRPEVLMAGALVLLSACGQFPGAHGRPTNYAALPVAGSFPSPGAQRYGGILDSLSACADPFRTARAIVASNWCGARCPPSYVVAVIPRVAAAITS